MAQRTHPHAEATYSVVPLADGTFSVEVVIPESYPTKVSPFSTEADAEAWIAEHRRRVQSEERAGRWFRSSSSSAGSLLRPLWISQRNPVGDATAGGLE